LISDVRDVKATVCTYRQSGRTVQLGQDCRPIIPRESCLPVSSDSRNDTVGINSPDTIIRGVGNVYTAIQPDCDTFRIVECGMSSLAIVAVVGFIAIARKNSASPIDSNMGIVLLEL